mmetsp:Transcript_108556/g.188519  ORF Transcript_108556/g.188519 Transcript_108556/m.188519 type:complete len:160 (+) Transcript_108556:66-545(+)
MPGIATLASILVWFGRSALAEEVCQGAQCRPVVEEFNSASERERLQMLQMRGYAKYAEELSAERKEGMDATEASGKEGAGHADDQSEQSARAAKNDRADFVPKKPASLMSHHHEHERVVVEAPPEWIQNSPSLGRIYQMAAEKARQHKETQREHVVIDG